MKTDKEFPNGFTNWIETHHEIVTYIQRKLSEMQRNRSEYKRYDSTIEIVYDKYGRGGLYELAEAWTDEFEEKNRDTEWDGEFFDEIDYFCYDKNYDNDEYNV